jgi:hypothetical protein
MRAEEVVRFVMLYHIIALMHWGTPRLFGYKEDLPSLYVLYAVWCFSRVWILDNILCIFFSLDECISYTMKNQLSLVYK